MKLAQPKPNISITKINDKDIHLQGSGLLQIIEILSSVNAFDYTRQKAQESANLAKQSLNAIPDSDFKTIIRMLTSSKAENTLEIKSTNTKCYKKVLIGVTPSYSVEGEVTVTFALGYVLEQKLQNKRDIIVSPFVKLAGKMTVVKGSISTEYSGGIGSTAETKTVNVKS